MKQTPAIVLSGYYGFDNVGDDAILYATIEQIKKRIPEASITVLRRSPAHTQWGAEGVDRYRFREVWRALRPGGLLLSGGGGLLQDATSAQTIFYYLAILWLARLRGMKTMIYAQGMGPLNRWISRAAVRCTLRGVDRITVRDEASAELLASLGLSASAVVTADPAFAIRRPSPVHRKGQNLVLAIAVRPWSRMSGWEPLAEALRRVVDTTGAELLFVKMRPDEDGPAAEALARIIARPLRMMEAAIDPEAVTAALGRVDAVLAMRLHAMILASISGVPSVALSYDPKVDATAMKLGLPAIPADAIQPEALAAAIQAALHASTHERMRIAAAADEQGRRAGENFAIIQSLLSD